jgi:uncharacterized integral membrane protein
MNIRRGVIVFGALTAILSAIFAIYAKVSDRDEHADQTMPLGLYFLGALPIISLVSGAMLGSFVLIRRLSGTRSHDD